MKNKIKTIVMVALLSCLVWILAERAVSQVATQQITIELVNNREDLLLQCLDENNPRHNAMPQSPVSTVEVELIIRGPGRLIQAIKGKPIPPQSIPLDMTKYAPLQDQPTQAFTLWVVDLLNGRLSYEGDYLQVLESTPAKIDVRVTQLVKRTLPIKVYDQYKAELTAEVDPPNQIAYVIDGQPAEARIDLSVEQQQQARQGAIPAFGQIILPDNLVWKFQKPIRIRLLENEMVWPVKDIKAPRLGILISPRLAKKWQVEVSEDALKEYIPIRCRGPAQSSKDYVDGEYHLVLEIKESDEKEKILYRPPLYNLPPGCEQPITIVDPKQIPIPFKLVPLPGATPETPK